jgi:hypothetical protein
VYIYTINTATQTEPEVIKFYYNGIKTENNAGKLQKAWYSNSATRDLPAGTITIYASNYRRFCGTVATEFTVKNDTDTQTDYFDNDKIRVQPDHPRYAEVLAAFEAQEAKRAARAAKRITH